MEPRREVRGDHPVVLESVGAVEDVVEVGVAVLVDLLGALLGGDEGHLQDQDLGLVDLGVDVEAKRGGVAGEGDLGDADLGRHLDARLAEVADRQVVADEVLELGLELAPPLPDQVAERRDGVPGRERDGDQFARDRDLVARIDADQAAPSRGR